MSVGIVVNMLVLPPLRDRQAARYVDSINRRMGAVLVDMAEEFSETWGMERADAWMEETESMSDELNSAWRMVKLARESRRENPRRLLRRKFYDKDHDIDYDQVLSHIDEGISHLRNLTRTMREATWAINSWDEQFREGWVRITCELGEAIADPDGDVAAQHERLDDLVTPCHGLMNYHISNGLFTGRCWQVCATSSISFRMSHQIANPGTPATKPPRTKAPKTP